MTSGPNSATAEPAIPAAQARPRHTRNLSQPADPGEQNDLLWRELTSYFDWYDHAATRNRWLYQSLKVTALVVGAAVTVLAAIGAAALLTAALAAAVVVIEGTQQVFQFHSNWISYRATAESIRQQALLYVAHVEPYADQANRRDRLGEYLRTLTSTETTTWTKTMRESATTTSS
jgi:hypothetical protein